MRKHGRGKRRTWRKIHLGVDEKTGEITAQVLTDNKAEDAAVLVDLVADTFDQGVDINKVGTDGVYDHYDCWDMLVGLEIEPIIPPRENAVFQLDEEGMLTDHPRNRALVHIRMLRGFLYLCAVIDRHSRMVLSWRLSNDIKISMDGRGRALDNVFISLFTA